MPSTSGGISILIAATESITGSGDLSITTSATYAGSQNRLTSVTDAAGNVVKYGYGDAHSQMLGQPTAITDPAGTKTLYSYDDLGRTKTAEYSDGRTLTYAYNGEGQLHSITDTGTGSTAVQHLYTYDSLRRVSKMTGNVTRKEFTYRDISDTQTTTQISSIYYPNLEVELTFGYTYDERGNIETISDPVEGSRSYEYDALGQLVRENNQTANKT